jgi:VWFA-related protein
MLRRTLLWTLAAQAQDDFVFKAGTAQVRVDTQVTTGGKAILGLTKDDFLIFDHGAKTPIEYCGQEDESLSVLLLLDVSGSMKRFVQQMSKAAQRALSFLNAADRAGVMIFSKETQLTLPLTTSLKEAAREIDLSVTEHKLPSGTAINAALLDAATALRTDRAEQKRPGRYAILILTDNGSLNYRVPDEQVLRALFEADTTLNALVVGKDRGRRSRTSNNEDFTYPDVYKLAEASGGEATGVERADEAFPEMMRAIRQRYALSYRLPEAAKSGTFRPLRVELNAAAKRKYPKAVIRARAGYYVP